MPHALEMLGNKQSYNDSKLNIQLLENRIKRLMQEEDKSKKLAQLANEKADKLLQARQRHLKELEEKFRVQELKRQQEEKLIETHRQLKEEHAAKVRE